MGRAPQAPFEDQGKVGAAPEWAKQKMRGIQPLVPPTRSQTPGALPRQPKGASKQKTANANLKLANLDAVLVQGITHLAR